MPSYANPFRAMEAPRGSDAGIPGGLPGISGPGALHTDAPGAQPYDPNIPGGYSNYFLNNTPEAGWWNYLQQRGLAGNGTDARSVFARNQYGNTYGNFMGQAADNPNEGFYDYLQRKQPDFEADFMAQSPETRGDSTSRNLTPKARFVKAY